MKRADACSGCGAERAAPRKASFGALARRAFTLLELLVVIGIIAILAGLLYGGFSRVMHQSRSAACMSNLRQIGALLNIYLGEHNMMMPTLMAGRREKTEEVPVIDNTLNAYTQELSIFACPADQAHLAERTGTSYYWNVALNGQALSELNFLKIADEKSRVPILADKEGFHVHENQKVNILYADGHVTRDLSFVKP